jgi:hypothetical protein
MATPLLACMAAVAAFYHLPPQALPAIHAVEGGRTGSVEHNRNGTDDLGAMQINTLWLDPLSHATGVTRARLRAALIRQDCFNVAVAGAILRIYLREAADDLEKAIGFYHSHTPGIREAYAMRVLAATLPPGDAHAGPPLPVAGDGRQGKGRSSRTDPAPIASSE